jgi:hypothetical protein
MPLGSTPKRLQNSFVASAESDSLEMQAKACGYYDVENKIAQFR